MYTLITTYGLILFYFALFFLAVYCTERSGSGNLKNIFHGKGETTALLMRQVAGIFYLGTCAVHLFMLRPLNPALFQWPAAEQSNSYWLIITALALAIGGLNGSGKRYPVNRKPVHILPGQVILFLFIRILFLVVYEIFFRGVVLFVMIADFGIIVAILANTTLYVLIHWFNRTERNGSLVMGIVLCSLTLYYQSVWPAITIHIALALSNDTGLIIRNRIFIKPISL